MEKSIWVGKMASTGYTRLESESCYLARPLPHLPTLPVVSSDECPSSQRELHFFSVRSKAVGRGGILFSGTVTVIVATLDTSCKSENDTKYR